MDLACVEEVFALVAERLTLIGRCAMLFCSGNIGRVGHRCIDRLFAASDALHLLFVAQLSCDEPIEALRLARRTATRSDMPRTLIPWNTRHRRSCLSPRFPSQATQQQR